MNLKIQNTRRQKHEWDVEVGLEKWRSTGSLDESCCRRPIKLSSFYRTQSFVDKQNNVEESKVMKEIYMDSQVRRLKEIDKVSL